MPTLTIRSVSPFVLEGLKKRAKRHRRSLNSEILEIFDDCLPNKTDRAEEILKEVKEVHKWFKGTLTSEEIEKALDEKRF